VYEPLEDAFMANNKSDRQYFDPLVEEDYWRENYANTTYVVVGENYADYEPAYRYGWEATNRYGELNWDEIEEDMERNWEQNRGSSRLPWERAKHAVRDAWERIKQTLHPDR